MDSMNGMAGSHQTNLDSGNKEEDMRLICAMAYVQQFCTKHRITYLSGYMRRPLSMPGQYDRKAASAVSNTRPKFSAQLRMPWCTIELRRVLHTIRSAHWTTTMDTKKAV